MKKGVHLVGFVYTIKYNARYTQHQNVPIISVLMCLMCEKCKKSI